MAGETQFTIGAKARCSDGVCGEVRRIVVDPATDTVTHLVIEPEHQPEHARLVPVDLVGTAAGGISLRCTLAEFGQLGHAEEREFADQADEYGGGAATTGSTGLTTRASACASLPRRGAAG